VTATTIFLKEDMNRLNRIINGKTNDIVELTIVQKPAFVAGMIPDTHQRIMEVEAHSKML